MSDTMNGTGGFGQFSDRHPDRWATLHPTAAPAAASGLMPNGGSLQDAAVEPREKTAGTSASALPKAHRSEARESTAPFGRRRIPPR
jgi:hypothetical protein